MTAKQARMFNYQVIEDIQNACASYEMNNMFITSRSLSCQKFTENRSTAKSISLERNEAIKSI